tara:strand:+ start:349 stop:1521 length:1173 start_codon:yes stop_codon:yes gene_type:complete
MEHKIIQRDIDSLIFAEYNPRQLTKDQHQHLKDSIQRFGLVDPILVNKHKDRKDIIIGGHQRVRVAKDLDIDKVPCIELSLTYEKERELNVRLNKNTGEWDMDNLANMFDMEELVDWGFDEDELIFEEEEPIAGLTDDDEVPEVEESICKAGDLWILGEHRLLCGDATKKEDVEVLMDGNKADMVFTDPPYGVDYDGGMKKQKKLANDNVGTGIYDLFMPKAVDVLKDDGAFYVWYADATATATATAKSGLVISAQIIWAKNHAQFMSNAKYKGKHEPCFYAHKKGKSAKWYGENNEVTLWEYDRASKNEYHPTQKPVALSERASKNSSPREGIILDVFLGSGSTLIACEKTGRKCYGMEIDPHYCDVIVKRWEQFTGGTAILDGKTKEI